MPNAFQPVLDGYAELGRQIEALEEQRRQIADTLFAEIARRLEKVPEMQIPNDLVFFDAPAGIQRAPFNQARWDLTDLCANFMGAYSISKATGASRELSFEAGDPVMRLSAFDPESQMQRRAIVPMWLFEYEPDEVAGIVGEKIAAAAKEAYPDL